MSVEPPDRAGRNDGVVVEKDEDATSGRGKTLVRRAGKASVPVVEDEPNASIAGGELLEVFPRPVTRVVVDDDHLEIERRRREQAFQAEPREDEAAEGDDNGAGFGLDRRGRRPRQGACEHCLSGLGEERGRPLGDPSQVEAAGEGSPGPGYADAVEQSAQYLLGIEILLRDA